MKPNGLKETWSRIGYFYTRVKWEVIGKLTGKVVGTCMAAMFKGHLDGKLGIEGCRAYVCRLTSCSALSWQFKGPFSVLYCTMFNVSTIFYMEFLFLLQTSKITPRYDY